VPGKQRRLVRHDFLELVFQGCGDTGMQQLALAAQHGPVGGILY
jgi:hypothetical protein